ncbi:MAG: autotransporter domain-containing protein [Pseudomonadota bacterium]
MATTALLGGLLIGAEAQAQTAEFVFLVDESGSMGGEQQFLQTFVPTFEGILNGNGVMGSYGLVGYGSGTVNARSIPVGGAQFGTAAEFSAAAQTLLLNGATEDGYEGIDFILDTYNFNPAAGNQRVIVLVTDEDRDNTDASLTFNSILADLNAQQVALSAILSQEVFTTNDEQAIGASATQTFTDLNNDGVPEVGGAPVLGNSAGTTEQDYTDLVFAIPGACVADLNILRSGDPNQEAAFAQALADCFALQVGAVPSDEYSTIAIRGSVEQIEAFTRTFQSHILMRLTGRLGGSDEEASPFSGVTFASNQFAPSSRQATAEAAAQQLDALVHGSDLIVEGPQSETFSIGPVRGFVSVTGQIGEYDLDGGASVDSRFASASVGIDYQFTPNFLAGLAVSFASGSLDADGTRDEVEQRMFAGSVYSSLSLMEDRIYIDTILSYGIVDIDFDIDNGGANVVTASTDGHQLAGYAEAGYNFAFDPITVTPAVALSGSRTDLDGYTDSAGNRVSDTEFYNYTVSPMLKFKGKFAQDWGAIIAALEVGGQFEFGDDDETLRVVQGGVTNRIDIPDVSDAAFLLNAGVGAQIQDRATFRFDYQGTYGSDVVTHALTGRLRFAIGG